MKKRYFFIGGIAFLAILIGMVCIYKYKEKHKYDEIQYGIPEFVTSMKDVNENLPTIILFKSLMSEFSIDAEVSLKYLHDDYGEEFNIVHANLDNIENKEGPYLMEKYEVTTAPAVVALDKNGNFIEKKENIFSRKDLAKVLKNMGVNIKE